MLMYCKKCGRTVMDSKKCDICGSIIFKVPDKYLLEFEGKLYENNLDKNKKDQFIEECIKSSPEFDEELFNKRDKIKAENDRRYEESMAIGKAILQGADPDIAFKTGGKNIPKCPICGSVSLSKISNVGKAASVGLFGIFGAGDLGKTWKCNNCGSKF